ncbi:MAG: hypothetical protein NTNFB02_23120 [Nitrospira sp.]
MSGLINLLHGFHSRIVMTMERKSRPWKAAPESMIIEDERGSVCMRLKQFKRHYVVVVGAVFSLDI